RSVERLIAGRPIPRLLDAPDMTAPEDLAHMKILVDLVAPLWFFDRSVFALLVHRVLRLALERGNPPRSLSPFDGYAAFLASEDRFASASAFGALAIEFARRRGDRMLEAKALVVCANFIFPWVRPLAAVLPTMRRAFELGVESGDLRFGAFALS